MAGFTFVELLLAATMISILFVGLTTHLRGGLAVWRQTTRDTESLQRQRVAVERMGRELANAFVYDAREDAQPPTHFGAEALRWVTVQPRTPSGVPAVRFVTYECADVNGTLGLWRTSRTIGEARLERDVEPELLLPDCEALSLEYAYLPETEEGLPGASTTLIWSPEWDAGQTHELPRLIRASIRLASGQLLQHLFVVPAGTLKALATPGS